MNALGSERFELLRQVAAGEGVLVHQARDLRDGSTVALKSLSAVPSELADACTQRVQRLGALGHSGIARYVGSGRTPQGELYLAAEWLTGQTLAQLLVERLLRIQDACLLGQRLIQALAAAERVGVVHGNLTVHNVFLVSGRIEDSKLLDFAVPRMDRGAEVLKSNRAQLLRGGGMSPELARGQSEPDARSDVFGLGCVLYECLTGGPAFQGPTPLAQLAKICLEEPASIESLRASVPKGFAQLVHQMLAKAPEARPSYAKLAAELSQVAEQLGARPTTEISLSSLPPRADRLVRPSLRPREQQRVMCAVFVGGGPSRSSVRQLEEEIEWVVESNNATCERLLDGSLIVTASNKLAPAEQAVAAARCALAIRKLLNTPIAVCTGRVAMEAQLPVGDLIDRGAALLEVAPPGLVSLDEASAGLLDARFEIQSESHGRVLVRERAEGEAPRTLLGRVTPFVGRERELSQLELHFRAMVADRAAALVVVSAPAGAGKSRLRYELLQHLEQSTEEFTLLCSRGDSMRAGTRFGMLGPAIRQAAGIEQEDPPEKKCEKLAAYMKARLPPQRAQEVTEILGDMLNVPFPHQHSPQLKAARRDPQLMADRMLASWLEWLESECTARPVLMLLEDMHWADAGSVRFLEAALRNLSEKPLLVLTFARPELRAAYPKLWDNPGLTELKLGKLGPTSCERLLQHITGPELDEDTRKQLIERADGNPFFLEELVRGHKDGAAVPDSVLGMVQARLDALGEDAKLILRAASVFGQSFKLDAVRALIGGAAARLDVGAKLKALAQHEVVFAQAASIGREYVFRHALIRDAAYLLLPEEERRVGHRLAAEWLEGQGDTEPALLAQQYESGGVKARAAECYRSAALQALEASTLEDAVRFGERAVACGAEGELLGEVASLVAEAFSYGVDDSSAAMWAQRARENLAPGVTAWWRASQVLAIAHLRINPSQAAAVVGEMIAQASDTHLLPEQVIALSLAASESFRLVRHELGQGLLELLPDAVPDSLRGRPEACVHLARTIKALVEGNLSRAAFHARVSLEAFRATGAMRDVAALVEITGYILAELGAHDEAERYHVEHAQLGARLGVKRWIPDAKRNLGILHVRRQQWDRAESVLRESAEGFSALNMHYFEAVSLFHLALALAGGGDLERADQTVARSLALGANEPPVHAGALAALSRIEISRGRTREALRASEQAIECMRAHGLFEDVSLMRLAHIESLMACGRRADARAAALEALAWIEDRASKIEDSALRQSFLANIPDNARILELARQLTRTE